ncbi:MAG: MBL fold metallo-hydrolase [Dehalococcoidia bacterium]|nr:MBL fold metallo-hydrolase [Dehalococcoidia bacterium]
MQVLEGVYQLITPFPKVSYEEARKWRADLGSKPRWIKTLPYVLPYAVSSNGETLLVDNGWNTDVAHDALQQSLKDHDLSIADVSQLALTHAHPDHFGLTGRVREESGCTVLMHEKEAEFIGSRYLEPDHLVADMKQFMIHHGVPAERSDKMATGSLGMLDKVYATEPDVKLKGGEAIKVGDFDFEVVWTPGHAPGHICLYEPNRKILLSGDHILPTITPNVSIHAQSAENPLGDYMRSLTIVEALDVDHVLPAHEFDIKELKKRITEIRVHHEERLEEMVRCVGEGGSSAFEVAGRVVWATGRLEEFEPFMQRAAVGETLAHLEYLDELGQVRKERGEDGIFRWWRA